MWNLVYQLRESWIKLQLNQFYQLYVKSVVQYGGL